MPAPGLESAARKLSKERGDCEVSKPEMMDDVGEVAPPRLVLEGYEDLGYLLVYVPATDIADGSNALSASCCVAWRSFSSCAFKLRDFSSSMFVSDKSS